MSRFFLKLLIVGAFICSGLSAANAEDGASSKRVVPMRNHTDGGWSGDHDLSGRKRAKLAFSNKKEEVKRLFKTAGVSFPPQELLMRVFKREAALEVWAGAKRGEPLTLIATYEICSMSGEAGPKRTEGDSQVPEGFYELDLFYNRSAYYLSMRIDYPNKSDRVLSRRPMGHSIMIHGDCVSIGCVAMSDERIQELWVMGRSMDRKKRRVKVHLFPGRDLSSFIEGAPSLELSEFWSNLEEGKALFESDHVLRKVSVSRKTGRYLFRKK